MRSDLAGSLVTNFASGGSDNTGGKIQPARTQFEAEQPLTLEWPRQEQIAGLLSREAKPRIIGRIAQQHDGRMAARLRSLQRVDHQRAAQPELPTRRIDSQRSEHQQ